MDTESFINIISRKPALWRAEHPQHSFRKVTNALWEEIKQEFPDMEVDSLRKKWKYLRCTYRRQLKKSQPNWRYFEMMGFLRDQYENKESDPLSVGNSNSESIEMVEVSSPVVLSRSSSPVPSPASAPNSKENCLEQHSDSLRAFRKRSNTDTETQAANDVNKKKKLEMMAKQFSVGDIIKSDDYYFLMSLLPQIVKLPPIQKLRLRNKFHQAVLDEMTACYGKS